MYKKEYHFLISLLEEALDAWENNHQFTKFGLCDYFYRTYVISYDQMENLFSEVHAKRTTVNAYPWTEHYWFKTRQERIDALRLTIKELKESKKLTLETFKKKYE